MELLKNIFYINLDERVDRQIHMELQFEKMGLKAQRISACKMKDGCVGCTLSHIRCLELAKIRDYEHICIIEDDAYFTQPKLFLEQMNKFHQNTSIEWDVLLVGGNVVKPFDKITDYCIRSYSTQTTTSYIVKRHYYDTLIKNFKESAKNLMNDPISKENRNEYALDMYWKRLQRTDRWYMIIPLTVSQMSGYSDIERRQVSYDMLLLDLDKEWFYRQFPPDDPRFISPNATR
jgi:GR25 family glycosyltransferase involved in LPS biosynthesis